MRRNVILACLGILLCLTAICQQNSNIAKGRVTDGQGHSLPNVTIQAVRSNIAATTDKNGFFTIPAMLDDTLRFSLVGYQDTLMQVRSAREDLSITLQKVDRLIEEVFINTGYQQLQPNEVNGAITVIDQKTLQKQLGTNILSRLEGVTNGLAFQVGRENTNPQNKTGITVRGYGTINGPLDPLIVIDNFVYDGDINNISPDDVESVSILKDAAATSIYGARGGNGVIVITTKRGTFGKEIEATVNINTTLRSRPNRSALQLMSNADYIGVEEMLFEAGYFNSNLASVSGPPITPIVYLLDQKRKGLITDEMYHRERRLFEESDLRKEYADTYERVEQLNQYGLNLSGGRERHRWMMSANHFRQHDHLQQPSNRTNLRLNNTLKVGNRITANFSGTYSNREGRTSNIPSLANLMRVGSRQEVPYMRLFDGAGKEIPFYQSWNKNLIDTVGRGRLQDWTYYPVSDHRHNDFRSEHTELLGNIGLDILLLDGLRAGVYYQVQQQSTNSSRHFGSESFYVRDLVNKFSQINQTTGEVTYNVPRGDMLSSGRAFNFGQSFRTQIDLVKKVGIHGVNALVGFEARESTDDGQTWSYYGYQQDPLGYLPVNHTILYRTWPRGATGTIGGSPSIEPTIINRFISVYGNASYNLYGKYSISGSFRRDGSNIYGVSTNDKWKPLWSLGLGYDMAKEKFIQRTDWFHAIRLRASLGYSGNVDLSRSALPVATYYDTSFELGGLRSALMETLNNPSLRWEQVRQINYAVDFNLKNLPISGSIDFYHKEGKDLYGITDYDYTTWGLRSTIVKNVAEMRGRGVDVQLNVDKSWGSFGWQSTLIYNYSISKTHKYFDASTTSRISRLMGRSAVQITPVEGYPLYAVAAYVSEGLDDQGNPQGRLNGVVTTDYTAIINSSWDGGEDGGSVRFVGSAIPTHFGSWGHDFRYKGVTLGFNLMYKMGYYFKRPTINYSALVNTGVGHPDYALRWQQAGDDTDVPSFQYPLTTPNRETFYIGSDVLVHRADHIRLQFINLSYNMDFMNRYGLGNSWNVYLNCSNVGMIWTRNDRGIDPENVDQIRPRRSFSMGLRTNF